MKSSVRKNKAAFYRRLKGLTQAQAAEILNTTKSNIANMESEKRFPSEAYMKLLNMPPRVLTAPLMYDNKALLSRNIFFRSVGGGDYENPTINQILSKFSDFKTLSENPLEIKGDFDGTDIYAWKADADYPEISVKCGDILPVIPRLQYKDGAIILSRLSLNKINVSYLTENGSSLLSVNQNEESPDICLVDIIGEIIVK